MNKAIEIKVCAEYNPGTLESLSQKYNVSTSSVYRALKKNAIPTSKKTHIYKEDVFDLIDTELKAYVLGLITSDGYIANKNNRYIAQLSSTDKEIPSFFAQLIEYPRPLYHIKSEGVARRNLDEWRIMVCSKRLVLALEKLGVVNGKSMKEVFCSDVPGILLKHYIRGIFDGDGSIGLYPVKNSISQARLSIAGSAGLLNNISEIFDFKLDISRTKIAKKDNGLCILQYCGNRTIKNICGWLYEDCNYYLSRKYDIACKVLDLKTTKEIMIEKQKELQFTLW